MLTLGLTYLRRRGAAAFTPPAGNVITNWAGAGTSGSSGLPDGWLAYTVAGVSLTVLSRTPSRGGNVIEFQFAGTATAAGTIYISTGSLVIGAAAAGQVWRIRAFAERVGSATPGEMTCNIHWRNASSGYLGAGPSAPMNGNILGPEIAPADATAPASTAFAAAILSRTLAAGQAVNLRYRVFAPTLWRIS